ncbi:MAG: peptide chain release factor N(5)-glutamine methyltransferase [Planctomycetota bacterium]
MTTRPDTVLTILNAASTWLAARGVDAPRRSVELLMGRVLGLGRLELYLAHDRPLSEDERSRLRGLVARRAEHEPLAHLLGDWEFFGHELEVGPAVLIPRPETEGLVELALASLPAHAPRIADLGTGSGAIAIALALARADAQVVAVDVSVEAIAVARRNVERHGLTGRVLLRIGSWWEPLRGEEPFDMVVSNPPYCDPAREADVAADVRRFEPALALWSPRGEPQAHYATIGAGAREHLRSGGRLLFETGLGAADAARDALRVMPHLIDVELRDDLEGRPRYLLATRGGASALTPR